MRTSDCRDCGLPVVWASNKKTGKKMPFDLEPDDTDAAKFVLTEEAGVVYSEFRPPNGDGDPRYLSHFDTCEVKAGRGPKTRASEARKAPAVTVAAKGPSVEVTVLMGDVLFSGTCYLVPKEEPEESGGVDL